MAAMASRRQGSTMHGWQGSRTWVRALLVLILSVLLIGFAGVSGSWEPDQAVAAPAAQAACSPRPRVQVNTTNSGADTLNITVSSSPTNSGPANVIQRIQFGIARNATIDVPSGPTASSGNFSQTYGGSTTQVTFTVRRQGGAMTVPFTVVDLCGDWPTFVGGGTQVGAPTATPTPTTVPALSYPAPGSRAYALSASTPHVAVIDTATNQLITTIKYADVGGIQASDLIGAP